MKPPVPTLRFVPLLLAVLAVIAGTSAAASPLHLGLAASEPEANATIRTVSEIRLRFTEPPQNGTVAIRLVDPEGELVATSAPTSDPEDGTIHFVTVSSGLPVGRYTVAWRAMGDDGHVVRGEFGFSVVDH